MRKNKEPEVVGFEQDANGVLQVTNGNEAETSEQPSKWDVLRSSLNTARELLNTAHEVAADLGLDTQVKQIIRIEGTVGRKYDTAVRRNTKTAADADRTAKKKERAEKNKVKLVALTAKVKEAGYSEADLAKLLGIKID